VMFNGVDADEIYDWMEEEISTHIYSLKAPQIVNTIFFDRIRTQSNT
jgi:hypothetical protein